jgi:hypothetical protein
MSRCQHGLHNFGFTGCQQEKDVTGRDQEWLWLQGICEEVVVVLVLFPILVLVLAATAAAAFVVIIIIIVVTSFSFVALQTITRRVAPCAYRQVS